MHVINGSYHLMEHSLYQWNLSCVSKKILSNCFRNVPEFIQKSLVSFVHSLKLELLLLSSQVKLVILSKEVGVAHFLRRIMVYNKKLVIALGEQEISRGIGLVSRENLLCCFEKCYGNIR